MSKFGLLFLLIFLGGIYALVFVTPVWGFYLYELIYFLNPSKRWWGYGVPSISYSFITVVLTLGFFYIKRKEFTDSTFGKAPEFKWLILLFCCYLGVMSVAIVPEMHSRFVFDLFKLYLILFLAYRLLDTRHKLELAILFYLIGCAYIGYEAFVVGRDETGRVEGIGTLDAPDSNGVSASIAPAIPLLLYYTWRAQTKLKFVIILMAGLVVNGIILINSRGAFLAVVAGVSYFMLAMTFSKYKLPKQRLMLITIIIVGCLAIVRFTDDAFWERMATIAESDVDNEQDSGAGRVQFWLKTFDMLEEHPLGLGVWGFQALSPLYLSEVQMANARREGHSGRAVHSMWFQGLAEVGWVGITVFFFLLLSTKRHTGRAKKLAIKANDYELYYLIIAIESAFITFLAAGSFINAFRAEIMYWMLLFCISVSVITSNQYQNKTQDNAGKIGKDE